MFRRDLLLIFLFYLRFFQNFLNLFYYYFLLIHLSIQILNNPLNHSQILLKHLINLNFYYFKFHLNFFIFLFITIVTYFNDQIKFYHLISYFFHLYKYYFMFKKIFKLKIIKNLNNFKVFFYYFQSQHVSNFNGC